MREPRSARHHEILAMTSVEARLAACPSCGAQPEAFCVTATGNQRPEAHAARWHASRKRILELRRSAPIENSTRRIPLR